MIRQIITNDPEQFNYADNNETADQAGCIQYDPVDVCGKNAELTLQSRVKGFRKSMLQELLYKDRKLVDYADKELSIWPAEDWPFFSSYRDLRRIGQLERNACLIIWQ